jgi:hypothetical protein
MMASMAKDRSKPLSEINFYCKPCFQSFKAEPGRVEDAPEQEHHPYVYYAPCPKCGAECGQASWEKSLLKAWANATGPRTEEGRAASAANLDGHPTPEEALRTRFNGMKHGMTARTATYFPAKPDGYDFCSACDVDRVWCQSQPACVKKTELFMMHHAAFEQRNPKHLMGIYADLQSSLFAVIQQILQTIIVDGVKQETVKWYTNKDGEVLVAEYVDEEGRRRIVKESIIAHPLFKPLGELLSRVGLTLADMGMTAKVIEAEDDEMGRLEADRQDRDSLNEFQRRQTAALENLAGALERARSNKLRDPVLIEHQAQNGGE